MPHLGPIKWLILYGLVWTGVVSSLLETYWAPVGAFSIPKTLKVKDSSYTWNW
uniref:ATP synthase F0 subunit 8 n=1 Tax=Lottia goshimai TaxID=1824450 RepID=UPI0021141EB4|nr:ATP synthase F0 subunit 8 [Lottia goshimai]UTM92229.1 ATP synthase F0 subunit 8 [Lottia peitaihoensis]